MVVEAEIFPAVLTCLKDPDEYVKKNVATLIREIAKHTPEVQNLLIKQYMLLLINNKNCLKLLTLTFNLKFPYRNK